MTEYDLGKVVGDDGEAGNGIASITKTGTSGLVDTYTITFDDGSTTTFTVTNGSDASVTIQTSWGSTTSDSKVPSEKLTKDTLDTKIAKSSTTGLVKNDGTIMTSGTGSTNYSAGNHSHSGYVSATKVTSWSGTVSDSNVPSEKLVKNSLDDKIGKSSTSGLVKNDGTVDTSSYLTTGSASSTYQPKLVSGTNIKTVNNESLLGSGNITIQGGSSVDIVTAWESTPSDSKVASEKLTKDTLDGKASSTHTHGNLTNDGKVGSTANYFVYTTTGGAITSKQKIGNITTSGAIGSTSGLPVITTTSGVLTTGSFGTGSGTFAEGNHTHSGYVSATKVTSWSSTVSDSNVASEKLIKDSLDGKQASLVSGTNIKTINNQSILGSGNLTVSGGGSTGDYFFTLDSFFDPNQWTGSPTINNGSIVLSADSTFPLRLPPNCTLSFDITVTNGYAEEIDIGDFNPYIEYVQGYNVFDFTITVTNNTGTLVSDATGDESTLSNISSRTGLSIPVTSGSTATISNVKYRNKETEEIYDLIGNAITYINGSGS